MTSALSTPITSNPLDELTKKEKKAYEALAALIRFVTNDQQKIFLKPMEFNQFKTTVLKSIAHFTRPPKSKGSTHEPKFNVKHYERAILYASDSTYRDMAIQAAHKDLTRNAMCELMTALRRHCHDLSKQVKGLTRRPRTATLEESVLWPHTIEEVV